MKNKINFLLDLITPLFSNYYYGFIQGNRLLSLDQKSTLLSIINSKSDKDYINENFEKAFSKIIGSGSSVSFASGRMAFFAYMKYLKINRGDEVIIQTSNCAVMINAILRIGAKPIFCDINEETLGTDYDSVKKLISSKTKLIVAQHTFGIPCNIERIVNLARSKKIKVIEDCALSVGSTYKNKTLGNFGDAAIFSFDHSKPINCIIGGILYSNDKNTYSYTRKFRNKTPHLTKNHQLQLLKQYIFESKYYNPKLYSIAKLIELKNIIINKFFSEKLIFLTDDFINPRKLKKIKYSYPSRMPNFIAEIGLLELKKYNQNKKNRIRLLQDYLKVFGDLNKSNLIPKAYYNSDNQIIPLRLIVNVQNQKQTINFFKNTFDIKSSWFQNSIIGISDPKELGYKEGSCKNSEKFNKTVINFPCTFEKANKKVLFAKLKEYLSKS